MPEFPCLQASFIKINFFYRYYMEEKPRKEKPSPQLVQSLLQMYPKLDYLMAETILSFSDAELGEMLEEKSPTIIIDDDQVGKIA